jgi:formamidopyrimidine-DNA glycosylase
LAAFNRGGVNLLTAGLNQFAAALRRENHTLKRTLTDPRLIDGIGNAYSDEILHRAGLSPFLLTSKMSDDQVAGLYEASRSILLDWTERLRQEVGDGFPTRVTAFHDAMAVHGKYGQPCPICDTPI